MNKRKWHYILPPTAFDVYCDKCYKENTNHGFNTWWSEYDHMIWCYDCEIDTEGTGGVFIGPIPIRTSYLLGIVFDKWNMETEQYEFFNLETFNWDSVDMIAKNMLMYGDKDLYGEELRREGRKNFDSPLYKKVDEIRKRMLKHVDI